MIAFRTLPEASAVVGPRLPFYAAMQVYIVHIHLRKECPWNPFLCQQVYAYQLLSNFFGCRQVDGTI